MKYMLLVTWVVLGTGLESYQVAFESERLCEVAAAKLQEEATYVHGMTAAADPGKAGLRKPKPGPGTKPVISARCVQVKGN